jgi:DHA1 family tetracycline resistance protein-like MFS transporter
VSDLSAAPNREPAVRFVFVTLVLIVLGWGIISPVLPGLVTEFEGGDAAAGAQTFGWILGVFSAMQFLMAPLLGVLSDRFGRRRIILLALGGSALDYVVMGWAPTLGWLIGARIVAGMLAGALTSCYAYVADVTPPEKRAQGFGLLGAAFGIGFILGPVVGGVLGEIDLRLPFFTAAGAVALNWAYGMWVLPESLPVEKRKAFDWRRANPVGGLLNLRRFPGILGLAAVHFFTAFGNMMIHSTWVLYTGYRYGWTPREVGFSLMAVGVAAVVVQGRLIRWILPKVGEKRGLMGALLIAAIVTALYGIATDSWMVYGLICVGSLGGLAAPATHSLVSRRVPVDEQGAVQGAMSSLVSLANVFAPPVAAWSFSVGIREDGWLPGLAFFVSASLLLAALGLAARALRHHAPA